MVILAHMVSVKSPAVLVCFCGYTGSGSRVGTGCNFRQRLTLIRHRRVLIIGGALIFANRKRIAEFALQHRLASAL